MNCATATGSAIEVDVSHAPSSLTKATLSPQALRQLKGALMVELCAVGFSNGEVAALVGASVKTIRRQRAVGYPDAVGSIGFEPPAARRRRTSFKGVSEAFLKRIRRDYAEGARTDDGEPIGDLEEVKAWLATLPDVR